MPNNRCPKCGSSEVVLRKVNDLLRAADPRGQTFEISLQLPVWRCGACKFGWQGQEALVAMETAYQYALSQRSSHRHAA
jgi:hypothetical protein